MPNLRVNVSGMGQVQDMWTDDAGRYEVKVPPGKYEVTFLPPPGFYLQHSIELPDARACAVLDWSVRFDGRLRGVLRRPQGGGPGAEIPVELMSADAIGKRGNISVLRTSSDSAGRFEFTEVVQREGGAQRELAPMTLPPAKRSHRVTGTVVYEDGPRPPAFSSRCRMASRSSDR